MSEFTPDYTQISQSQSGKETTANRVDAMALTMFGIEKAVALAVYFAGGRLGGTHVAATSLTMTASNTNYVVAHRTTLVLSVSTGTTNWNDDATYGRVAKVTAGTATVTDWEDHRFGELGILWPSTTITATVEEEVNHQTGTTYTILSGDQGKLVTFNNSSSIAVTLPQATGSFGNGFFFDASCIGVGGVTITPTTSTIDGASTLVLRTGQAARIISDGTNYYTLRLQATPRTVNAQTGTTYTYLPGDYGKVVTHSNTSAIAGTLAQATGAFGAGWCMWVQNRNSGVLTITPTTSTIDGAATLVLYKGMGALVISDGTNYYTVRAGPPEGGAIGYLEVPQNSQSAAYTTVLADSGKHILHPSGDANARTFTIDSNANVPYPVGTAITFVNETSQVVTIAITSDTLTLAGTTTTGSRSLAQNGIATALKITSTKWIISGVGLT